MTDYFDLAVRLARQARDDNADGRDESWHRFVTDIDDLLATGRFTWAQETLNGIRQVVEQQGRVTAAQRRAVKNIETGLWPGRWR